MAKIWVDGFSVSEQLEALKSDGLGRWIFKQKKHVCGVKCRHQVVRVAILILKRLTVLIITMGRQRWWNWWAAEGPHVYKDWNSKEWQNCHCFPHLLLHSCNHCRHYSPDALANQEWNVTIPWRIRKDFPRGSGSPWGCILQMAASTVCLHRMWVSLHWVNPNIYCFLPFIATSMAVFLLV